MSVVRVVEAPQAKRVTCHRCRCVLEYSYHDIREERIADWDGGHDTYYRITCPACSATNNVNRWR